MSPAIFKLVSLIAHVNYALKFQTLSSGLTFCLTLRRTAGDQDPFSEETSNPTAKMEAIKQHETGNRGRVIRSPSYCKVRLQEMKSPWAYGRKLVGLGWWGHRRVLYVKGCVMLCAESEQGQCFQCQHQFACLIVLLAWLGVVLAKGVHGMRWSLKLVQSQSLL